VIAVNEYVLVFAEDDVVGGSTVGERVAEFVQRRGQPGLADDVGPRPPGN